MPDNYEVKLSSTGTLDLRVCLSNVGWLLWEGLPAITSPSKYAVCDDRRPGPILPLRVLFALG